MFEFLLSLLHLNPNNGLSLGGIITTLGLLMILLSKGAKIDKLNVGPAEIASIEPWIIKKRYLFFPGIFFLVLGLVFLGYYGFHKIYQKEDTSPTFPTTYDQVQNAEILVTEIDDKMMVNVNDSKIIEANFGETPPWIPFEHLLKKGPNKIEIIIINGTYEGCGGRLTLRLNKIEDPAYDWIWVDRSAAPDSVCFRIIKTLYLD